MMVIFLHAARAAMVVFNPYLSSRPLANALMKAPEGQLIAQGFYYQFSSVFFYTNRTGLLLSARKANLEYGADAPGAPLVFIDDSQLEGLWGAPGRQYLLTFASDLPRYQELVAPAKLVTVAESGGKVLLTNHPLDEPASAGLSGNFGVLRPSGAGGWGTNRY